MKKVILVVVLLILAVGGYFLTSHLTGGSLPTLGLPLGGESSVVRARALAFVEDLHFKDYHKAASVFEPHLQSPQNVRLFLETSFEVSAQHLDLIEYIVKQVELDSTKTRARVSLNVKAKNLLSSEEIEREWLLFLYYSQTEDKWYISVPDR